MRTRRPVLEPCPGSADCCGSYVDRTAKEHYCPACPSDAAEFLREVTREEEARARLRQVGIESALESLVEVLPPAEA